MSNDVQDERRLYQCARKYGLIAKQFDELVAVMNSKTRTAKRRKSVRNGNPNTSAAAASSQPDGKDALVQTITRFLQELRTNPKDAENLTET